LVPFYCSFKLWRSPTALNVGGITSHSAFLLFALHPQKCRPRFSFSAIRAFVRCLFPAFSSSQSRRRVSVAAAPFRRLCRLRFAHYLHFASLPDRVFLRAWPSLVPPPDPSPVWFHPGLSQNLPPHGIGSSFDLCSLILCFSYAPSLNTITLLMVSVSASWIPSFEPLLRRFVVHTYFGSCRSRSRSDLQLHD